MINCRGGMLRGGSGGHVHGGDRLPWVRRNGTDNFEPLRAMSWQAHVYGSAKAELSSWCTARQVPLHVFDWKPEHEAAGLARDALYLLRPDTYVSLADASGAAAALGAYFADRAIKAGAT